MSSFSQALRTQRTKNQAAMTQEEKDAEQKIMRFAQAVMFACSFLPFVMTTTFCALYWKMWSEAIEYDDNKFELNGVQMTYDSCGGVMRNNLTGEGFVDTQWSVILAFNSILNLCLTIFVLCTCVGSVFAPLLCLTTCGHCFGNCAYFAAIITTGVIRYSTDGKMCQRSDNYVAEGVLFSSHANTIQGLFISQVVLFCGYYCCAYTALQVAMNLAGGEC